VCCAVRAAFSSGATKNPKHALEHCNPKAAVNTATNEVANAAL
jgi:hypothetical protein